MADVKAVVDEATRTVTFGGGVIRFTLPEGVTYRPGYRPSQCRSCDTTVLFVSSRKTGRLTPIEPDGTSHFANCPDAAAWRRARGSEAVTRARVDPTPAARLSRLPRPSDGVI